MITLTQSTKNLIAQFVKIIFKILALHLLVQAMFFLDDIEVKKLKTMYNNKELLSKIRQYMVKYIQNLDKILTNLKQVKVIIVIIKSQLY